MDLQYFPMDRQLCYIEIESCKCRRRYISLTKCSTWWHTDFSRLYDEWYPVQVERRAELGSDLIGRFAAAIQGVGPPSKDHRGLALDGQLLETGLRNPVRPLDGLLPDPDLHPVQSDRHHLVGLLLAEQGSHAGQSRPRGHHRLDHDHVDGVDERGAAQNILRQVHRRLLGRLLLHGVRLLVRVRQRRLHGQAHSNEEKQIFGLAKDGRTEEERGHECG